ncbi:MAG TPA: 50S ribosomal protein L30 [Gemmatimonadales bacterium]|nr:50S ribosomal protein L30 [Gemmatimonadales bacterium]
MPTRSKTRAAGGKLRVKQVRSGIGHPAVHRRTLRAIGLKHHQDVVVVVDSPSLRGMLNQVRHLVEVTPAGEG